MKQIEMFTSTESTQLTTLTSLTWAQRNPDKVWTKDAVKSARKRCKGKEIPFNITAAYLRSILPTHCPVFGTKFVFFGSGVANDESPSLDRLIPSKGYVEGNVAIISVKANRIKSAYQSKDLYKVAQWLEQIEGSSV